MISVLILTKNEERDLPGCLDSVAWSDDVFVFDGFSEDATVEIARRRGARVARRRFDNYARQRNAALKGLPFKHRWTLILDADERVPPALRDEMGAFVRGGANGCRAARIRRRDYYENIWLRHAQITPFYIRLAQPAFCWYERSINEVIKVAGPVGELKQPFDHYPFSKGLARWIEKHNRYSSMEAELMMGNRKSGMKLSSFWRAFFAGDFHERRRCQKELFCRLPARPFLKLGYMLFWRGAILDGRAGVTYSLLQAVYEYFIVLKTRELRTFTNSLNASGSERRGP